MRSNQKIPPGLFGSFEYQVEKKHIPVPTEQLNAFQFFYMNNQPVVYETVYCNKKKRGQPEYYVLDKEEITVLIAPREINLKGEVKPQTVLRKTLHRQVPQEQLRTLQLFYTNMQPVAGKTIYYNKRGGQPEYYVLGNDDEEITVFTLNALRVRQHREKKKAQELERVVITPLNRQQTRDYYHVVECYFQSESLNREFIDYYNSIMTRHTERQRELCQEQRRQITLETPKAPTGIKEKEVNPKVTHSNQNYFHPPGLTMFTEKPRPTPSLENEKKPVQENSRRNNGYF